MVAGYPPGAHGQFGAARRQAPGRPTIRLMASARVTVLSLKMPRTADVTVFAPGLRTPRMAMHRCSASMTTITPRGLKHVHQRIGDLAGHPFLDLRPPGVESTSLASLDRPVIWPRSFGM